MNIKGSFLRNYMGGVMGSDTWEKFNLAEIMEIVGGGTPRTTVAEYWNGIIPWISVVDFGGEKKLFLKQKKA